MYSYLRKRGRYYCAKIWDLVCVLRYSRTESPTWRCLKLLPPKHLDSRASMGGLCINAKRRALEHTTSPLLSQYVLCRGVFSLGTPERSHSILLQFSINGGITWHLMDEFYFPQTTNILFINVPLPYTAQTNATRFRLWQPYNNGKNADVLLWSGLTVAF